MVMLVPDLAVSVVFSSSELEIQYRCFPSASICWFLLSPPPNTRPLAPEIDINDTHKKPLSDKIAKIPRKEIKITILH